MLHQLAGIRKPGTLMKYLPPPFRENDKDRAPRELGAYSYTCEADGHSFVYKTLEEASRCINNLPLNSWRLIVKRSDIEIDYV